MKPDRAGWWWVQFYDCMAADGLRKAQIVEVCADLEHYFVVGSERRLLFGAWGIAFCAGPIPEPDDGSLEAEGLPLTR